MPNPYLKDEFLDQLYQGIISAETGPLNEKKPMAAKGRFIRTEIDAIAEGSKYPSSAYGPAQITFTLAKDVFEKDRDLLESKGLTDYANKFLDQGRQMLKARNDDPIYGLKGSGVLNSEEYRDQYKDFAKLAMRRKLLQTTKPDDDIEQIYDKFLTGWRGRAPEEGYKDRFFEQMGEPSSKAAKPTLAKHFEAVAKTAPPPTPTQVQELEEFEDASVEPQWANPIGVQEAAQAKLKNLREYPDDLRAKTGAKIGSMLGAGVGGDFGALIGANLGAFAARSLGSIMDGKAKDIEKKLGFAQYLSSQTKSGTPGVIEFSDGSSFNILPDGMQLPNVSSVLTGQQTRTKYDIDTSNPLTNRALSIATPLAQVLSTSMKERSSKTPREIRNLLVNALTNKIDDIAGVLARASELASRLGVNKDMLLEYFEILKPNMNEAERKQYLDGMSRLYES